MMRMCRRCDCIRIDEFGPAEFDIIYDAIKEILDGDMNMAIILFDRALKEIPEESLRIEALIRKHINERSA